MNIAILAGGKGTRLGGVEKSQLEICGLKIIDRLMSEFSEFNTVIVCRNEEQKRLFEGYDCITDTIENFGPLAGIHSALDHFKDRVAVLACDMPFVKKEVVEVIYGTAESENIDVLMPIWSDGRIEPLLSAYSPSIIPEIERSFEMNERKILKPVFRCDNVAFYCAECLRKVDKNLVSFFNINTREDLRRAEEICSSMNLGEK